MCQKMFFQNWLAILKYVIEYWKHIWKENPGALEKSPADGLAYIGDMGWFMIHTEVHTLDQIAWLIPLSVCLLPTQSYCKLMHRKSQ